MPPALQFGDFRLDSSSRTLRCGDRPIALTGRAFDLLAYMAANPGRPLSKDELLKEIWRGSFVEESNLSQGVFVIRKALGVAGEGTIRTLPGRGYLFTTPVAEVVPAPPGPTLVRGLTFEATETRVVFQEDTEVHVLFWRSPVTLSFAFAALALLGLAGWLGWQRYEDRVGGPPVQVVVADPDGSTGDPALDRALGTVFRMELAQSPFVTILSGTNVRAKMAQMQHKPDDRLVPALAREVCERSGSQAVVHGSMAKAGTHYILTEEATNCVDGTSLGEASREVSSAEQLPQALAKLAGEIRYSLGESRRTIARFSHPLSPVTTASLDALKDLTEAERLGATGRIPEAVDLLKQAVALDPGFAQAWLDLSTFSLNTHENTIGHQYLQKAYDLRGNAAEPTRRNIVARYNGEITGDLYESLRNYRTWTEEYPRQVVPWSGRTVTSHSLGSSEELSDAERTMAVAPVYQAVYQSLGEAQTRAGDFAAARTTLQAAIAKGFDVDSIRSLLLRLAYVTRDAPLRAEQETWGRDHPDSPFLLANQAFLDQLEGRTNEAERVFNQAVEACRRLGLQDLLEDLQAQMAIFEAILGHPELAQRRMATEKPRPDDPAYLYALQYTGNEANVESLLREQLVAHARSTLWNEWDGPILRGKMLLDGQKPTEALKALAPTTRFDGKDVDAIYLRGLVHMQLNELPEAAAEFHKIIDRPQINPTAIQRPLAQLQVARILAQEGNKPAATAAYRAFLAAWAGADPGQALPKTAEAELAALQR